MVTIADGGELKIENIAFDGVLEPGKALAKAGISTAFDMIQPYTLTVDGCEFQNFGEGGFFAIKGTKATFAKSVTIRNCFFRDLSGDAINYAAEKDDIGRYNADDMLIENCSFYVAVAVRAINGRLPISLIIGRILRYSGRKSCPHSEIQCASSTA